MTAFEQFAFYAVAIIALGLLARLIFSPPIEPESEWADGEPGPHYGRDE